MKRKTIVNVLLLALLSCCLVFALVACGGNKYTVTFDYGFDADGDGTNDTITVEVDEGSLLERPADPSGREGYEFVGWGNLDGMWDFATDTVQEDMTLNAKWSVGGDIDPGTPDTTVYVNYDLGAHAAEDASAPARVSSTSGTVITLPEAPAAALGYAFTGWLVSGETEVREAGSSYTVSGTVTIVAQWTQVDVIDYEWKITKEPTAEAEGEITGTFTPAGGGVALTVTVTFPLRSETNTSDEPAEGMYNVVTTDSTCIEKGSAVVYYTIPATNTYESASIVVSTTELELAAHSYGNLIPEDPATCTEPGMKAHFECSVCHKLFDEEKVERTEEQLTIAAAGHKYGAWNVEEIPEYKAGGKSGRATRECTVCEAETEGHAQEVTLPCPVDEDSQTGLAEGYAVDETNTHIYCDKEGTRVLIYTVSQENGGGTVSVSYTVAATGHKWSVSYADKTLKAVCLNECGTSYSVIVKFDANGGNGSVSSLEAVFDGKEFTFKLPAGGFSSSTGAFLGWSVEGVNYAPGQEVAVAPEQNEITYVARYEQHTHSYGLWNVDKSPTEEQTGSASRTCNECGEGTEGKTQQIELPVLTAENIVEVAAAGKYVLSEEQGATCTAEGVKTYTYTVPASEGIESGTLTVELKSPALGHDFTNVVPYIETEGETIGYLVADCARCSETISIGKPQGELEVSFKGGKTGYAIDEEITLEDFTVTLIFDVLVDVPDGVQAGTEQRVELTDADIPENIAKYLEDNFESLSTKAWANGLKAEFTYKVSDITVASGSITFDVVPTAAQLGIGDAAILYNKAGDATNHQVNADVLANVSSTGVSVSFWLSKEVTSDWTAFINNSGLLVALPNLDPYNNISDEAADLKEMNKTPAGDDFCGNWIYSVFLGNLSYVTVTLNADGSVSYYKNGVKVISYAANDVMSNPKKTVADFTTTLLRFMATSGFRFADGADVGAANLFVTSALNDDAATAIYNWYSGVYLKQEEDAFRTKVVTALEGVTIYATDAGKASGTILPANSVSNVASTGVSATFYIPAGGVAGNDWGLGIRAGNGFAISLGILDAYTATGEWAGLRRFEAAATAGPACDGVAPDALWETFIAGDCYITISMSVSGGVAFYKNGVLAFTHAADGTMDASTKTVSEFVSEMLASIADNGMQVSGADGANHSWAENCVVTSALTAEQVLALYNAITA